MTFLSYAQNFEDVMLWRALKAFGPGFYVDAGACDPDTDSVTRAFYERGWRGINIEPVEEFATRLAAARPGDVTLRLALGEHPGETGFTVVEGTGLSTAGTADAFAGSDYSLRQVRVEVQTLAEVCRRHAREPFHFLKVDVEGAERPALAGADFATFRPWIVLVEATVPMSQEPSFQQWEPVLVAAGYRFVWFDGLNRFYVAAERFEELAPSFQTPPNVFDDFIRVADNASARRLAEVETRARLYAERAAREAERSDGIAAELAAAQARAAQASGRVSELVAVARRAQAAADRFERESRQSADRHARLADRSAQVIARSIEQTREAERRAQDATAWLSAMRTSRSWQMTRPVRAVMSAARRGSDPFDDALLTSPPPAPDPTRLPELPGPAPLPPPDAAVPAPVPPLRTVHQFHSGSAVGDAITQSMLLVRGLLRGMGFQSDVFVEHRDPGLAHELRRVDELPRHDGYVLIVHHSMGFDAFARVLTLPAPKVLLYHNITPSRFLDDAFLRRYAGIGREQLAAMRGRVVASLADSEFNALELRRLGFDAPRACSLLFDLHALLARAANHPPARGSGVFTVLFVGRIVASKAQADLVEAFALFARAYGKPARLVLVGRPGGTGDAYGRQLDEAIRRRRLQGSVVLAGLVPDAALHGWYAAADLYVSLSHHEGFGVPLVEAVAHGVPVLAWPSGAVPFTLGDPAGLLRDRAPDAVALRLRGLAERPEERAALARRQRRWIERFRMDAQLSHLVSALALAGAAPPEAAETPAALAGALRFTVAGHVNKTYSLSSINRTMAMAIDDERPGTVRLVPVETVPTADISEVPAESRRRIEALVARPEHVTGPEIVVSQHYPVYVPPPGGDARVALFFWEESLVPAATVAVLNASFDAVFAPTGFVAKVLRDSGLSLPIHTVGHAPDLGEYRAVAARHARRAEAAGAELAEGELAGGELVGGAGPPFTFLHVSSCFPRKGVDLLLAAYARAFRSTDRVRLRIKGFPNPHNDAAEQVARLRAADPGLAAIEVIDRDLSEAELADLFADADALVLPTRGEGFNLPAAEAMAAGVPLIVTGYGGHLDFCGPDEARLVDYRFAASGSHLATPHSVWVEPDVDDLERALREVASDGAARLGQRAAAAAGAVAARLARDAYVRRLVSASTRVLLTPPPAPIRLGWVSTWNVRCGVAEYSRHLVGELPPTEAISGITIFADRRAAASDDVVRGLRVTPSWQGGHPDGVEGLALAINQADPDVMLLQHQPGLFHWDQLAALIDASGPRAIVLTLHNTRDILDAPDADRRSAVDALRGIDRVLVHTVADLNLLKALGLVANVALLPHGAPVPRPEQAARALAPDAAPVIGCYGFFLPDKGIPELVAALATVRRRWPAARLRLVNAEYDARESADEIRLVRARAKAAGLADAIDWHTGFEPDDVSLDLLAGCDVIVLPYQRSKEASSASLRMALAAGPPVMVTNLGLFDEAKDVVAHCDGVTPADIARSIERLLDDVAERARVQAAARSWLLDRDWSAIARRLQGILLGLVAQRRAARVPPPTAAALSASPFAPSPETAAAGPDAGGSGGGPGAGPDSGADGGADTPVVLTRAAASREQAEIEP